MTDSNWHEEITPILRICQIIVGALIVGCVMFLVIVLFQRQPPAANAGPPVMTYVALAFTAAILVARAIVPGMMVSHARRRIAQDLPPFEARSGGMSSVGLSESAGDGGRLALVYQVKTIVAGALLEGPAFFMLIAHMIEGSLISLSAALALILGLVLMLPTHGRMVRWIEDQLMLLEQDRQMNDARP